MRSDPKAVSMDVRQGNLLRHAIALLNCCSRRISMAQTACSQGLAEGGMRGQIPPPGQFIPWPISVSSWVGPASLEEPDGHGGLLRGPPAPEFLQTKASAKIGRDGSDDAKPRHSAYRKPLSESLSRKCTSIMGFEKADGRRSHADRLRPRLHQQAS